MRSSRRRRDAFRKARFEPIEPRLVLSALPVTQVVPDPMEASPWWATAAPSIHDAHALTGLAEAQSRYDFTGAGQTVVIIDSGVAYTHAALGGGFGEGFTVVGGWDFTEENDADPYDDGPFGSHGTHVAGIIASKDAANPGVAPGVQIVALRVFNDAGRTQLSWVENALRWVHENRFAFAAPITTVNLSMGMPTNTAQPPDGAVLEDELAQLAADGIFVAAAAGNGFTRFEQPGLSYPASSPHVVAAGSVDATGEMSYFSQRTTTMLAAPGRSINSTVPDYAGNRNGIDDDFARLSGTSMASPYVAGAAVLVREAYQFVGAAGVSPQTIYETLYTTADLVYDSLTGQNYRMLNVARALDSVMAAEGAGSNAAAARHLGTIGERTTWNGSITSLAARDYYSFTAAVDGRIRLSVDGSLRLGATLEVLGRETVRLGDGRLELAVEAGHSYTLAIGTAQGLGHYTLDLTPVGGAPAMPMPVVVDQIEHTGISISPEGRWFAYTAAHDGIFTVEATFDQARGDVDLELNSSGQQRLAGSYSSTDNERVDVTLRAGETVYVRAWTTDGKTHPEVDLRVTNLVRVDSTTVSVRGTAGDDTFLFVPGAELQIGINGADYRFDGSSVAAVHFDGLSGADTARLYGSEGSDTASLRPGSAGLSGPNYRVSVVDVETIWIDGRGGRDTASFDDSPGNDVFTASPGSAELRGDGFTLQTERFEIVHAYARSGGTDEASLYDSPADDFFVGTPDYARLIGDGFLLRVKFFQTVHAYASAGNDRAQLTGSAAGDMLIATPTYARLVSPGKLNRVKFFDQVLVFGAGGYDRVYFHDSAGDDTLVARPGSTSFYGTDFRYTVRDFASVAATSSAGGNDIAHFHGSAGADAFFADSVEARMSGSNYVNRATGFAQVVARGGGGYDQATLFDSVLDDHFRAEGNLASLENSSAAIWVYDFQRILAISNSGGKDVAEVAAVDYVLQILGAWDQQ